MKKMPTGGRISDSSLSQTQQVRRFAFRLGSTDLFWVLCIVLVFRIIYYSFLENTFYQDSDSYLNYSADIFHGHVNKLRTPLYPYFLKLVKLFAVNSQVQFAIILQSVISFIAVICFYKIARSLYQKRMVIKMTTIIFGIMPTIINFDKCILTESLSLSLVVFFMALYLSYLKRPNAMKALFLPFFCFLLIMLRPSFLFFLPVIILIWFLRISLVRTDRKNSLLGLAASAICVLLLEGYSSLNYHENGYQSISSVSLVNQLDNIINYNMYTRGGDPEISTYIKENHTECKGPYNAVVTDLVKKYDYHRLNKFVLSAILNQPKIFFYQIFKKLDTLSQKTTFTFYSNHCECFCGLTILLLARFISVPFMVVYGIIFLELFLILYLFIRFKKICWFNLLAWPIITGQLSVTIIGAQNEYERLFVIAVPVVIILVGYYFDIFFSICKFDKKQLHEYIDSNL